MNISDTIPTMVKIVIVDDCAKDSSLLLQCLEKYFAEVGEQVSFRTFDNPLAFLECRDESYDLCFLDVEMPGMNGLELAHKMRDSGNTSNIVFVTNIYSLAASGYEVDALDYILKPVKYPSLSLKMDRIIKIVKRSKGSNLVLKAKGELLIVNQKDIKYVEVSGHNVTVHTTKDDITLRSRLSDLQNSLDSHYFSKCNNCYLVNLSFVSKVIDHEVFLDGGISLQMSFPRKNQFMKDLSKFVGGSL